MTHQLVERIAVPPVVHVGLAEPERPVGQHALEHPLVVDPDVPGAITVDADVGALREAFEVRSQSRRGHAQTIER